VNQSLYLRAPSTIIVGRSSYSCVLSVVTSVRVLVDFPPKKGEELDKVFQDLEDLLKI